MKEKYLFAGIAMFVLELIAMFVFYLLYAVNWTVELFVMLITGGAFLVFNVVAIVFILAGLLASEE